MSLTRDEDAFPCECRECGNVHSRSGERELFSANITHNLNVMAQDAGIYLCVWRPDECGITKAGQLIGPLSKAVALMRDQPERFKRLDPENGWGSYATFLPWLDSYLEACLAFPDAYVKVSR